MSLFGQFVLVCVVRVGLTLGLAMLFIWVGLKSEDPKATKDICSEAFDLAYSIGGWVWWPCALFLFCEMLRGGK